MKRPKWAKATKDPSDFYAYLIVAAGGGLAGTSYVVDGIREHHLLDIVMGGVCIAMCWMFSRNAYRMHKETQEDARNVSKNDSSGDKPPGEEGRVMRWYETLKRLWDMDPNLTRSQCRLGQAIAVLVGAWGIYDFPRAVRLRYPITGIGCVILLLGSVWFFRQYGRVCQSSKRDNLPSGKPPGEEG